MTCPECRTKLADYLETALSRGARRQVDEHLAGCAECQAELARLRTVDDLLSTVRPSEPPADLWSRVEAGLSAEPAPQARLWPKLAWGGALAAAAIGAFLWLHDPVDSPVPAGYLRDHYRVATVSGFGSGAVGDVLLAMAEEPR